MPSWSRRNICLWRRNLAVLNLRFSPARVCMRLLRQFCTFLLLFRPPKLHDWRTSRNTFWLFPAQTLQHYRWMNSFPVARCLKSAWLLSPDLQPWGSSLWTYPKEAHWMDRLQIPFWQGWKKPGFFKKTQPSGFFLGFFGFFWVFWVFLGFFGFFCPDERVFRVFFSFTKTFRWIQTLNYNHSY